MLGRYRIHIFVLCGIVAMLDGFDTQSIAFVAPEIAAAWSVPAAQFGPVFGIGIFGGLIGALVLGAAGDRYGRKIVLLVSMLIFALGSLATVTAASLDGLLLYRLVTGFGLGGAIPGVITITSEYAPRARRTTIVTLMFCGFPLGAVLGGAVSAKLIPAFGWASVFYLGGALPLLLFPLVLLGVPESIRLLASWGGNSRDIARVLGRIDRQAHFGARAEFFIAEQKRAGFPVRQLFAEGRAAGTLLLWTAFFMSLLLSFFLINWMPALLRGVGLPIESAVIATVTLNAGGIVGSIVLARFVDRFGPYAVIAPAYAVGTVFVALVGLLGAALPLILATVFLAGFFSIGAQLCAVTLVAVFYPTAMRATGIGWCMGIGRIGAIAGPVIGGALLGAGFDARAMFFAAAAASILAAASITAMGRLRTTARFGARTA